MHTFTLIIDYLVYQKKQTNKQKNPRISSAGIPMSSWGLPPGGLDFSP